MATANPGAGTVLDISAARVIAILFVGLVAAEIFFVVADHFINVGRLTGQGPIRRFFNITREDGLASWFAVTQTWMVGLTAGLVYLVVSGQGGARWRRMGWLILMFFLLYMAMDDGAEFHERIGSSVKAMLQGDDAGSGSRAVGFFPSYAWQLVFLPIFGAFGLFMLWFLNRELVATVDKLLVLAAVGLLVMAVAADFFEGIDTAEHALDLYGWISATWGPSRAAVLHYSKSVEEFVEMLSMSVLWLVFLRHLVRTAPTLEIRLRG